jgi:soluble lytic murein transglycosylase-like protein
MKKYSHLFLLVVLLNSTSNAQNTQTRSQGATAAPKGLSKTATTTLQSLGKAAAGVSSLVRIAKPAIPTPSPKPPTKAAAAQEAAKTSSAQLTKNRASGRGIRSSISQRLNGQSTGDATIDAMIVSAATRYGIEPLLLYSVMCQESRFQSQAVSPKGARGLMQLMPATAARFGVKNIFDPEQNIYAGARYLRFLLDLFDGDVSLALAGYNAGEGAVKKYGYTIPPYRETVNYVRKIRRRYSNLSALPKQDDGQTNISGDNIAETE